MAQNMAKEEQGRGGFPRGPQLKRALKFLGTNLLNKSWLRKTPLLLLYNYV
jgi:hypothetical protein